MQTVADMRGQICRDISEILGLGYGLTLSLVSLFTYAGSCARQSLAFRF